jgi:hypothetical protein
MKAAQSLALGASLGGKYRENSINSPAKPGAEHLVGDSAQAQRRLELKRQTLRAPKLRRVTLADLQKTVRSY